jgi:cytoskeletal protein CcmA (bactofilin family)
MFSKNNKNQASAASGQPQAPAKPAPPSLISRDLKIKGNLDSDGEIQVDGAVEGDIRSKTLLIGESAHITGEITADSVVVHGTVNGQIKARAVRLAASAHMVGDILHEDLAIETGAFLEGHCRRIEDEKAVKPAAAAVGPEAKKPQPAASNSQGDTNTAPAKVG